MPYWSKLASVAQKLDTYTVFSLVKIAIALKGHSF